MTAVLLYGPPASGKDSVTDALTSVSDEYQLFQRLKVGGGRSIGYRRATDSVINALRAAGDVVWENERYGARYVIDRPALLALHRRTVPVVHLGQREAIEAVTRALNGDVMTVALWCPRDVAAARIAGRGTGDTAARLDAWDATAPFPEADLTINTSTIDPSRAARVIHERRILHADRSA
ncbi:MAG: kinase [Dehalococcoidia bacterium]